MKPHLSKATSTLELLKYIDLNGDYFHKNRRNIGLTTLVLILVTWFVTSDIITLKIFGLQLTANRWFFWLCALAIIMYEGIMLILELRPYLLDEQKNMIISRNTEMAEHIQIERDKIANEVRIFESLLQLLDALGIEYVNGSVWHLDRFVTELLADLNQKLSDRKDEQLYRKMDFLMLLRKEWQILKQQEAMQGGLAFPNNRLISNLLRFGLPYFTAVLIFVCSALKIGGRI